MSAGFVIRRVADGRYAWYAGTVDRKPQFGPVAAPMPKPDAEVRVASLRRLEPGVKFEVIAR